MAWRVRCALGRPATVILDPWDVRIRLPARWRGVSKLIYAFRERYEPELRVLAPHLPSGGVMIDIGANIGIYTLVAARLVGPYGRVLAFEPAAEAHETLMANLEANSFTNVLAWRLALTDAIGTARLSHEPDASRNAILTGPPGTDDYEEVETGTLDAIDARERLPRVDLIKVDVEGAEELALRGAAGVLARHSPVVIFEVNPEAAARLGLRGDGAWKALAGMGYRFYGIDDDGAARPLGSPPPGGNVVALRGGRR